MRSMAMTKLTACIVGLGLVLAVGTTASAHQNDELESLLIGGIGGAAIGHVVSGTPEGVIIGSFLGGTIGILAAGDYGHRRVIVNRDRYRHPRNRHGYAHGGRRNHREGWYPRGRNDHREGWYPGGRNDHRNHWNRYPGRHHR